MKYELLFRGKGNFRVFFPEGELSVVRKVKILTIDILTGMGYNRPVIKEEGDLFFVLSSVGHPQLRIKDIINSLERALKS